MPPHQTSSFDSVCLRWRCTVVFDYVFPKQNAAVLEHPVPRYRNVGNRAAEENQQEILIYDFSKTFT